MQTKSLLGLLGVIVSILSGLAMAIWPDQLWIAQSLFAALVLGAVIAVVWWFFSNFRLTLPFKRRHEDTRGILAVFLRECGELLKRKIVSDAEYSDWQTDYARWRLNLEYFVKAKMADGALERLNATGTSMPFHRKTDYNEEHGKRINGLMLYQKTLTALMDNDSWRKDKPKN